MQLEAWSYSLEDTKRIAAEWVHAWVQADASPGIILLQGDMGAGKSAFVRATLHALGLDGVVGSPTFPVCNLYEIPPLLVSHLDLYRLHSFADIMEMGLTEAIATSDLCFIEWADLLMPHLRKINRPVWEVAIQITDGDTRCLRLRRIRL